MSEAKLFFGGVPTEMEVNRLREVFPADSLKPGDVLDYSEVAKVIDCEYRSHRFTTVTSRWRKILENECGVIVGTEPGLGFKVLDEPQKVDLSGSKLRSAVRAARRSYVVLTKVDRKQLSEEKLSRFDHIKKSSAAMIGSAQIRGQRKPELPSV